MTPEITGWRFHILPNKKNGNKHLPGSCSKKNEKNNLPPKGIHFFPLKKQERTIWKEESTIRLPIFRPIFFTSSRTPRFACLTKEWFLFDRSKVMYHLVFREVGSAPAGFGWGVVMGWYVCFHLYPISNWLVSSWPKLLNSQILCLIKLVEHFHPDFFRQKLFFWGESFYSTEKLLVKIGFCFTGFTFTTLANDLTLEVCDAQMTSNMKLGFFLSYWCLLQQINLWQ